MINSSEWSPGGAGPFVVRYAKMSHQITIVIKRGIFPSVQEINEEISRLDLGCHITNESSCEFPRGSFNCLLEGVSRHVEILYEESDWLAEIPELKGKAGDRDQSIDFWLGTDMVEGAIVSAISCALASKWDALVYYPPDDLYLTLEESISECKMAIAEALKRE